MDEDDDNRLDVNEVLVMVSAAMGTEMGADLADARKVLSAARDEFGKHIRHIIKNIYTLMQIFCMLQNRSPFLFLFLVNALVQVFPRLTTSIQTHPRI